MKAICYIFLFAILFFLTTCSPKTSTIEPNEKAPVKIWDKTLGEVEIRSMTSTNDGGYMIAGNTYNISSNQDYGIMKVNSEGVKLWYRTFGGDKYDFASCIISTSDGGFVIAGSSTSGVSGDKTTASKSTIMPEDNPDYWIVKVDANGKKVWDKTIGGNKSDYAETIISTSDGGYIVGGKSDSDISGDKSEANRGVSNDYWIVKLSSDGQKIWDKTIGGTSTDELNSITASNDGSVVILGTSFSTISGDKTTMTNKQGSDFWVVKIDDKGQKLWDKSFGNINNNNDAKSIITTEEGNYIISGTTQYGEKFGLKGVSQIYILKINSFGEKVWDKSLGGIPNDRSSVRTVINTKDNGIVIGCQSDAHISEDKSEANKSSQTYYTDYWIIKLNKDGQKKWDRTIGGDSHDTPISIIKTLEDNFIVAGWSSSGISGDKTEVNKSPYTTWLVKLGF